MKRNIERKSIRKEFFNVFIVITILLVVIYTFYFFMLYNNFLNYEEEKINIYNKSISQNIYKDVKKVISDIDFLTKEKNFQVWNISKMGEALLFEQKQNMIIDTIVLINNDYKMDLFQSSSKDLDQEDINVDRIFNKVMIETKFFVSENIINDKLFISINFPVYNYNKEIIGAVIIYLNIRNNEVNIFKDIIDPNIYNWQILLTTQKGMLIYNTHKAIITGKIEEIDYTKHPAVKRALLGKWELDEIKYENSYWYTSSEIIEISNWMLIVMVPRNLVFGKVMKVILPNFIILFFIVNFFLLFIWFQAGRFIKPIVKLTFAIREYGEKGNVPALHELKEKNEISEAIKTFNKMIAERKEIDKEILQVIERERKRVGKNLHDDLEEILSGIYNQYLIVREELNKILRMEDFYVLSYLEKISKLLNNAINKTKYISNGLCPVSLIDGDLIKSINELIKSIENAYKINISMYFDEKIYIKEEIILLNMYYIIQEAINNALINEADKIEIKFSVELNSIIIKVSDNRKNFSENNDNEMSERIMNYSARLINAVLKFERKKNGNNIVCTLKDYTAI